MNSVASYSNYLPCESAAVAQERAVLGLRPRHPAGCTAPSASARQQPAPVFAVQTPETEIRLYFNPTGRLPLSDNSQPPQFGSYYIPGNPRLESLTLALESLIMFVIPSL